MENYSLNRVRLYRFLSEFEKNYPNTASIIRTKLKKKSNQRAAYCSDQSIVYFENKPITVAKMVKTTFGRYVRRQLCISEKDLSDTTLNTMSQFIKLKIIETLGANNKINLLSGKDLLNFYKSSKITSCMSGPANQSKIAFYADNPDRVFLATNGSARGLVFVADDGTRILSSVYGDTLPLISECISMDIKYYYFFTNKERCSYRITLNYNKKIFPYFDVFKYAELDNLVHKKDSGKIVLSADPYFGNVKLTATDGSWFEIYICSQCGNRITDVYNDKTCYGCYVDGFKKPTINF